MEKVKIGIIGTGHLGKFHTKLAKELNNAELIGVYDKDFAKAKTIAEEFSTKAFENLEELIKNTDAVSIVATTSAHYELAKYALENNVHVLVEKPITSTIEQAEEIIKIAADKNLKFQVGHIERFNPALLCLDKYNLDPKFIETDRLAQFNPRGTDVAVVLDLMIHDIDIILSLIKSDVKEINASGVAVVSDNIDIANARLEFENGAVANVTASRISQKRMRKMRMFQKDTYLSLDFNTGTTEIFRLLEPTAEMPQHYVNYGEIGIENKKKVIIFEQPEPIQVNALQHELQLFVDAVFNDTKPAVSGEDGLKALKVADMIINKIGSSTLG